jgi:hypothetical protein
MLLKILIVGALVIGAMAAVKQGSVLRDAGLLSSCGTVFVNGKQDTTLQSCSKGRLDGYPDLTDHSCSYAYQRANRQYWECAAPVVSSQSPTG